MKVASIAILATLAGFSTAQGLSGLPTCAESCAENAIPASCGVDVKCICSTSSFISSVTCCVAAACDAADQEKTIQYAESLCSGAGVTNLPTAATCSSSAASAATGSSSMSMTANSTSTAASLSSAAASNASSVSSSAASGATLASTTTSGASSSATASSSSGSTQSSEGNTFVAQGLGALGMAVAGVVALF